MTESLGATTVKAKALRMHCQTSGWSLASKEPANNIIRTTMQAMAAAFGGTQSLHTNAFDEAISLPTPSTSRLARNTQLIMQHETKICDVIDPWAGSYMMESLTDEVISKVRLLMQEIEAQGGVIGALENGWVNQRIQENAARVQAKIENGAHVIVGKNQHIQGQNTEETLPLNVQQLEINSEKVLSQQLSSLVTVRAGRNQLAVKRELKKISDIAAGKITGNLLEATICAIKARATIGECTNALELVWPRFKNKPAHLIGEFSAEMKSNVDGQLACNAIKEVTKRLSRKPKILITKIGQDGHDRGAILMASALYDAGLEVHIAPLFLIPKQISDMSTQLDVDIVGVSSLAGAHLKLLPELVQALMLNARKIQVVVGGVIPDHDFNVLLEAGVAAIYNNSESIPSMIQSLAKLF